MKKKQVEESKEPEASSVSTTENQKAAEEVAPASVTPIAEKPKEYTVQDALLDMAKKLQEIEGMVNQHSDALNTIFKAQTQAPTNQIIPASQGSGILGMIQSPEIKNLLGQLLPQILKAVSEGAKETKADPMSEFHQGMYKRFMEANVGIAEARSKRELFKTSQLEKEFG